MKTVKPYFRSKPWSYFSNIPLVPLISHWIFQSILYLDRTERIFKILLDILGTLVIGISVYLFTHRIYVFLIAFVVMHTLNFLFNGHVWVVIKFYGLTYHNAETFYRYLGEIANRARREPSLCAALIYGSIVRGEFSPSSDLDLRLVRKSGFWNGVRACCFQVQERTRALLARFPLDTYVVDNVRILEKMSRDEIGYDILTNNQAMRMKL